MSVRSLIAVAGFLCALVGASLIIGPVVLLVTAAACFAIVAFTGHNP